MHFKHRCVSWIALHRRQQKRFPHFAQVYCPKNLHTLQNFRAGNFEGPTKTFVQNGSFTSPDTARSQSSSLTTSSKLSLGFGRARFLFFSLGSALTSSHAQLFKLLRSRSTTRITELSCRGPGPGRGLQPLARSPPRPAAEGRPPGHGGVMRGQASPQGSARRRAGGWGVTRRGLHWPKRLG